MQNMATTQLVKPAEAAEPPKTYNYLDLIKFENP